MSEYIEEFIQTQYIPVTTLSEGNRTKVEIVKSPNQSLAVRKTLYEYKPIYKTLKKLKHPGLVPIFDVLVTSQKTVIVEQYISGETLQQLFDRQPRLTAATINNWLIQLAVIMSFIHRHNIIHRDIKPSNIIISSDGIVKLIDFDCARSYNIGQASDTINLGTKGYAAPEQYGYSQTDARSDIYSFGILCQEFITIAEQYSNQSLLSMQLKSIFDTCTQIDPDKRYQNADLLIRQFKHLPGSDGQKEFALSLSEAGRLGADFNGQRLWRFIVLAFFTFCTISAATSGGEAQSGQTILALISYLWTFLPPLVFLLDNFFIRTWPVMPFFQRKRRPFSYAACYFLFWFISLSALMLTSK